MAQIEPKHLADSCVFEAFTYGVNPHYLLAVAQLRSGMKDDQVGAHTGPFKFTQAEWDANCADAEFELNFAATHIARFDLQATVYAVMTWHTQQKLIDQLGRQPSAEELYKAQWPDDPTVVDMQQALDATRALVDPAVDRFIGAPLLNDVKLGSPGDAARGPAEDPEGEIPQNGDQLFLIKAPRIMQRLIEDFDLTKVQAAGILGNIGHECAGFRAMEEIKPVSGGAGGIGMCMWTGPRRTAFEQFCAGLGLPVTSDAANYGFLREELNSTHKKARDKVKFATSLPQAVSVFEEHFEKAHKDHKHMPRRERWARLALDNFKRDVPAELLPVLDPDLKHRIVASVELDNMAFWVVDQFAEGGGGQVLIRRTGSGKPKVLLSDTRVIPVKSSADVPLAVAKKLNQGQDAADPFPGTPAEPVTSNAALNARVFAQAKASVNTLITRNVKDTNNGRLACAWAVNKVVENALGKAIGGGLSTIKMGEALRKKHVELTESQIVPGAVVISPTGKKVGHVGIVGGKNSAGQVLIYSNSSDRARFEQSHTLERWRAFYAGKQKLPVLFYALDPGQF